MICVQCDFGKIVGKIKPMNAVNNGPSPQNVRGVSNFDLYRDAHIPFARLHDSSFCDAYGGEYSVDVHRIFRDFDADENDEKSYDFEQTDIYLKTIKAVGTEIFYRLGASIEHYKKAGTIPPKDNLKWAKICEHIIRHYNEGWANGFHYNIVYWEIWNEPFCCNPDGSNPCWQGTAEEFAVFFAVVAKYLKRTFPHLKIGGPAFCTIWGEEKVELLKRWHAEGVTLDFISYHRYSSDVYDFVETVRYANDLLEKTGYGNAETYLDEWNYIEGWLKDEWIYSLKSEQGIKGASFVMAVMCALQKEKIDGLMYYDARLYCGMNGLFDGFLQPRKGYYAIKEFGDLLQLEHEVETSSNDKDVFVCAATSGGKSKLVLTYFNDNDSSPDKEVTIKTSGLKGQPKVFLLDDGSDLRAIDPIVTSEGTICLTLKLFDTVVIEDFEN